MPGRSPKAVAAADDAGFSLHVVAAFIASVAILLAAQVVAFSLGLCADRHLFVSAFGLTNTGLLALPIVAYVVYKRVVRRLRARRHRHHIVQAKGRHTFS
ncbi:hypothetical protein SPRG_08626 [Saprolegnia parasitica CBS 223.65]|uniref:Uncharacterized protein n=1 Tax=Saprolegnia parasitica (strain CBS 223.65) TaxID=695850 RepID=A0A067C617_SAPPC|nr:hypothetical protein SPRG_08626 [Saprolegnia parasitica CBS 223.65]KDO25973.1 hypothetical protein SPRG_08626 [Saprolegnia parasitica CBS 223.65]|eukprot:XP_012203260.1 hypothetical protein SPRG_08626 [Saprolegnia parasitica CBS 223.65]